LHFFLGPLAGALVSIISLRRMGHPLQAKRIFLWTLLATAVFAAVLVATPQPLSRFLGIGAEIGFYLFYPKLQETEFAAWEAAHPDLKPSSGWRAVGWGLVGFVLLLIIAVSVAILLSILFPSLG
jgi:hypothetical protein